MKKVFLSLAFVAVLTVVSCKKADAEAVETTAVDTTAVITDTTAVVVDSTVTTTDTVATPAAETPAK
jgi:hypothetical protein